MADKYCAHRTLVMEDGPVPLFHCLECNEPLSLGEVVKSLDIRIDTLERRLDELYDEVQTLRTH
jgi:transcription initiation factor IIE alpha subunit